MAWLRGLKTTYYLRALGATSTEKSTLDRGTLNAVQSGTAPSAPPALDAAGTGAAAPVGNTDSAGTAPGASRELGDAAPTPPACSIDDPECEACQ